MLFYLLVSLDRLTDPVEKDFVSWLLQKDCNDRPFADEALKHPFFRSVEEQFNFLVAMGKQREIVQKDESCDVVTELNNHLNEYPNGWKEKIHPQVKLLQNGTCTNGYACSRSYNFMTLIHKSQTQTY